MRLFTKVSPPDGAVYQVYAGITSTSGLQLCRGSGLFFGLLGFIDVNRQAIPLNDASLSIPQRLTSSIVPTKLAIHPAQAHHTLVRSSGLNCVIENLCGFWKVGRVARMPPNQDA